MADPSWAKLPSDVLASVGHYLDAPSWAAARATCGDWGPITHGVKLLEIDVERDAHRWMMVLTCVARLFPRLSSVVLLCGNRVTPAIFAERMAALAITSIKVEELELRFLYLTNPRLGAWLEDLSGIAGLRHLMVLRLAGGATPPPPFFEGLTALRRLRTLELLPGVYGQIAGFDMDVVQPGAGEDGHPAGSMGVCDAHLETIGRLTQLNHISLRVCPHETTPAGLAALTSHGLLEQLEHLALYDAELPCSSLKEHLSGASKLTGLQFGLSSVSRDLGAITRLTSLKEISLDTAFLPSVQDLVLSAASGGLPPSGPGAVSGLCLLDQTISSPEQLACLTSFGSLSELVLVNPTAPAPGGGAANVDGDGNDEFYDELANEGQHNQQQQEQQLEPIDLAVLSGLTSLRMLQVDVALRSYAGGQEHALRPLPLRLSAASVEALLPAWQKLETLDLSGLGGDLLPEDALTGLSRLSSLRYLSVMAPGGSPHDWQGGGPGGPPDFEADFLGDVLGPQPIPGLGGPAAAAAGSGGGSGNSGGSAGRRSWPWWHVPKGLASLCLSHMDLTGRGASQCTFNSSISSTAEPGINNSSSGKAGSGSSRAKRRSSSAGGPREGEEEEEDVAIPCCLLPAASRHEHRHGLSLPGLSLFHNNRASPLRPLSKRRRQTKQRTEHSDAAAAASGGSGSSQGAAAAAAAAGCDDGADAAAGSRQGAGEEHFELLCSCVPRLPAHFSCLQSLLLEHVTLPHSFLPRVLPPLASSLESLALLHVSGTRPADMASLAGLTMLTSLRLIPSDHDVGGLEPLLGMRHLKKLNMRLTHLQPSDVALLGRLRSLFCLSLAAPCLNAALLPGFPSAVRLQQVEDVVAARLPYCDVELQPEPDMTAVE